MSHTKATQPGKRQLPLVNLLPIVHVNWSTQVKGKPFWYYCTFQKHMNSEVQKPTDIYIFRCPQSSEWTSQETRVYFNRLKRSWFVNCGFRTVLSVSLFRGLLLVIVIMIGDNKKCICEGGFWTPEWKSTVKETKAFLFSQWNTKYIVQ